MTERERERERERHTHTQRKRQREKTERDRNRETEREYRTDKCYRQAHCSPGANVYEISITTSEVNSNSSHQNDDGNKT